MDATIVKLQIRHDTIEGDKQSIMDTITTKEEEISSLKSEVAGLNTDVKGLEAERQKIEESMSELESMKLDPVKEHNAKRVAKKK